MDRIQRPHLEEICRLPEAHLAAADHIDGVFESFVLREFGSIDGNPLVLETGLCREP